MGESFILAESADLSGLPDDTQGTGQLPATSIFSAKSKFLAVNFGKYGISRELPVSKDQSTLAWPSSSIGMKKDFRQT